MDAYSIEIAARWKMDDARRDAELRQLIRAARRDADHRPSRWHRPTLRRLRGVVHPMATA